MRAPGGGKTVADRGTLGTSARGGYTADGVWGKWRGGGGGGFSLAAMNDADLQNNMVYFGNNQIIVCYDFITESG